MRAEIIEDIDTFTRFAPEWNALLRDSAADCPFLTWEWLHAWWTHLRGMQGLRLLTVRDGDELTAIAPLLVSRGTLSFFSRAEFLGTGYAGSDYLDVIVRRGCEEEGLQLLARSIDSQNLAVRFTHLPPSSLTARLVQQLAGSGWRVREAPSGICPFIPLAGHTWDSYLATLGPAHRANFRRRLRGLARQFQMRFEPVTSESQRHEALSALVNFHEERWTSRGGSTAFQTADLRAFHNDVTRRALDCGWLRLYELNLNDTTAAVMYGFHYNGRFYFYQHGFGEQYRTHGVGLVLMGLTIQSAIEEGASEFDMLYGGEAYKWLWTRDTRPMVQLDLFPSHIGGRVHQRTEEAERTMRTLAKRVLSMDARAT